MPGAFPRGVTGARRLSLRLSSHHPLGRVARYNLRMRRSPATARTKSRSQLNRLIGPMCELMGQLERAITEAGELADTRCGAMTPQQHALLSSFALLLARLDRQEVRDAGTDLRATGNERLTPPRVRQELAELQRLERRASAIAQATAALSLLLEASCVDRIVREIDARGGSEQALVHVFELLLSGSNRSVRRSRGVYFTPYPLVQYIVRSVDLLLRRELNVDAGLMSSRPPLRIVDPACGSGAFLLGVLQHARRTCVEERNGQGWPSFVRETLLPSMTGIDVMPACCGAAEMLIQRLLAGPAEPARTPPVNWQDQPAVTWSPHCGNALSDLEPVRSLFADRVPVILGNPPYAIFGQRNRGDWILGQLDEYKRGLDEKKLNLDDDFIKFLRWAQYWIDQAGRGVVAMVTNNTYLTGLTHRRMRASLSDTFDQVYLLDLHGSSKKRESAPDGTADENVFPIQQGVAIGLFVKTGQDAARARRVMHADLWGTRDNKLKVLAEADVTTIPWTSCRPHSPWHFFVPRSEEDEDGYRDWPRLSEIFQRYVSGVQTKCDALFVGYTFEEVENRMSDFLRHAAHGRFTADVPEWLRSKAGGIAFDPQCIRPYMVAPLDMRWVYYEPRLLGRARHHLVRHWDIGGRALVFMRQATDRDCYDHFLVTDALVSDRVFYSAHGAPFVAPLHVREGGNRIANLQPNFLQHLTRRLGIPFTAADEGLPTHCGAGDVLHWLYAAVHSRTYRRRYHALLCIDFPRIAWPRDADEFTHLCQLGKILVENHLNAMAGSGGSPDVSACMPRRDESGSALRMGAGFPLWRAGRLRLSREFVWPDLIEAEVWEFRLGGYRVLERWLKQRRRRPLSPSDMDHLARMIQAIRATGRIMDTIASRTGVL